MAKGLEARLGKAGKIDSYNRELRGYINCGVLKLVTAQELEAWGGAINYIGHHPVYKPDLLQPRCAWL